MGTIAQKLTYLNGTKTELKESINNLGGDITSETTFREYAQELDNIYDNLPKTTGEGTNLSLTTIKGKMNTTLKGDTQQNGTPTPDTPINIEVVTGTQEVKVENKNLLKFTQGKTATSSGLTATCNDNSTITINGTSSGMVAMPFGIDTKPLNGNYTLSGYTRNDTYLQLYTKNSSGTIRVTNMKSTPTISFSNETLFQIFIFVANGTTATFNNETFNLQLEKRKCSNYIYTTPRTNTNNIFR